MASLLRPSLSASIAKQAQPQPASQKSSSVNIEALQNASRVLQEQFAKDAQIIPDLGDMLSASAAQVSASYSIYPDDSRVPYQKRKFVSIPDGLFQHFDTTSVISHMGIMPEIERVWISIDYKLFLWDYVDGHEISSFVDQPDVITHVALVKPKPGLFVDEISSLLVICTPVSVLLIGVAFVTPPGGLGRPHKEIQLYATDLVITSDVEMTSVIGTADGRVFMCGAQDGNLYELHYQGNESWFGKRIQLINHSVAGLQSLLPRFASSSSEDRITSLACDSSRNCFYTLSSKGSISFYRPGGEKAVQHIQTISNIYKLAQDKAPGSPALTPTNFQIVSLHVIDERESRSGPQLFAITANGVRLYFSPASTYGYGGAARPLQLSHVRLPPNNLIHPDEQSKQQRSFLPGYAVQGPPQPAPRTYALSLIDSACYIRGMLVATQQGDMDGSDYILCLAPDLTKIGSLGQVNPPPLPQPQQHYPLGYVGYGSASTTSRPPLTEYATVLSIPGRTWAMAPTHTSLALQTVGNASNPSAINELASQFLEPPQQFMLLTNVGLTFLVKRRPIDYLNAVLEELQTEGNVQPIIEFRDSFGRDQTCSMLLGLASGNTFLDGVDGLRPNNVVTFSPEIASVAKQAFYDFGERPMWTERVTYGTTDSQGTAIYSGRREGLALYFARLVRPFWTSKLVKPGKPNLQQLGIPEDVLVISQKNLFALRDFLDRNPHLFHSSPNEPSAHRAPIAEQEAWRAEQSSVSELMSLLSRTIEALSFVLLLNDHHLEELISHCESDVQKLITSQTFEDLITTQNGLTISRALVNVVIDRQIGQQISVDTISEVLQLRCGTFCSTDDVMLYKAKENIRKAAETKDMTDRHNRLAESLRLFTKGARILGLEKLQEICGDYQQLSFAKGAVELPLVCASVFDPDGAGLEYWRLGLPPNDARAVLAEQRLRCYALVMDSLSVFEEKCSKALSDPKAANTGDPEIIRAHAYELAFASQDEMFHSALYDWLINRNLADDLLEMRPAFLEAHLRREPVTVQKYQLLWQFYVKNDQPLRAAQTLAVLAESDTFDLDLETRLEYLTLAVANAKSHPISATGRHETAIEFLTDLEEKLDVAQVQLEIYQILAPHLSDAPEVGARIKELTKHLFNMTELYQRFAIPFDIPDIKLLCLHVSEHREESIVRPIWTQIFNEVMQGSEDPSTLADLILGRIVPLGKRFYPSESAFPLRMVAHLLVRFSLANKDAVPSGWAPRVLVQCGVPFVDIWDVFHEMYESQVPPFNDQANVQSISSDIATLLADWLEEAKRPQSALVGRGEFPVGRIDAAVDQYLAESSRAETKAVYESIKRQLRRNW